MLSRGSPPRSLPMRARTCALGTCTLLFWAWLVSSALAHDDDWKVTLYGARLTADSLGKTLTFRAEYENSYLVVLAVSKRLFAYKDLLGIELEGQVGKHFGAQDHWELNIAPVFRWLKFPWDGYLDTSLAAGAGLSYALSTPKVEAVGVSDTPKLLGYLMFEIAVSLPSVPHWSLVARLHHRSGAGGAFGGRHDASNALGLGIRYGF
jgi:hypothetical protein